MATLQELIVKIGADTDGLDKISQATDKLDKDLGKVRDAGAKVTDVGKSLTAGVTTPLVGMGAAVLKTAGDFESSMNSVRAVTGATGVELDQMSDLAREMGSTTQFSASESAAAMEFLGMAGLDTTQIMDALPGTLSLAAAGGLELADAADISTNILSGMNMEVSELGHLNDVLADASRSANTDVQQLGMGMKQVAPVASGLGFELEETTAALGFLADAGIQGEQGGTLLRSAMSQLINPTAQAGQKLAEMGVQATEADGSARPLADIMRDFEAAGADASDMMQIFGTEAGPAMIALLNRGGDDLEGFTSQLENSAGTAEEMADIKMEGLSGQLKSLASAAEGLMLAIADSGLLDTVTDLVEKITEWVQGLSETNPELLKWGTIIGVIVAALGPMLIVIGSVISAVGQIGTVLKILVPIFRAAAMAKMLFNAALWASPITWIIIGIIALIAVIILIIVYWDEIKAATAAAWDWIVEKLSEAWEWIKNTAATAWEAIKQFFVDLWNGIVEWVTEKVQGFATWLSETWTSIKETAARAWELFKLSILVIFLTVHNWIMEKVNAVKEFIRTGFNNAKQLAINAFTSMRDRVTSTISNLVSKVKGIPGKIKSGLGNLKNLLVNAGKNVVQGLINGIKNMFGKLSSAASDMASKIRDKLPFSPAKEGPLSGSGAPEASGARIAENLGDGILAHMSEIDRAADALMAPLDDRVDGIRATLSMAAHIPANVATSVRHSGQQESRVVIDVTGADEDMKRLIRKMVRTDGRGDVQKAFGR